MKFNPQDHRTLELGLTTLHVTRLDPKKVHKVVLDWGLNQAGAPASLRPCIKLPLVGTTNAHLNTLLTLHISSYLLKNEHLSMTKCGIGDVENPGWPERLSHMHTCNMLVQHIPLPVRICLKLKCLMLYAMCKSLKHIEFHRVATVSSMGMLGEKYARKT